MPGERWFQVAAFAFLIFAALFSLTPIYWLIATAFKSPEEAMRYPPTLIPTNPSLQNFIDVFRKGFVTTGLKNSIFLCIISTFLTLMISSITAYSFSSFNYRGKNPIMVFILFVQMIPLVVIIVPLYLFYAHVGLVNTYLGMIIIYVTRSLPLSVWLLRGYFMTLPKELEDAALIDGCGKLGVFFRIILPLSLPGLMAAAILTFLANWNDFILALTLLVSPEMYTFTVDLFYFIGEYGEVSWGQIAASSVLGLIPVLIFFAFTFKYLVRGLTLGAVKR